MIRDRSSGFALIQAVAALGLSALVVLLMLTIGSLTVRSSDLSARRVDEIERFATGLSAVRRELAAAKRIEADPETGRRILFSGQARSLGLVHDGAPGQQDEMVMIIARAVSEGGGLVRVSRRLLPDMRSFDGDGWSAPVTLIDGPWLFEFAYAGVGAPWAKAWSKSDRLPAAVYVGMSAPDRISGRTHPGLVVPIRVDIALPCLASQDNRCAQHPNEPAGGG